MCNCITCSICVLRLSTLTQQCGDEYVRARLDMTVQCKRHPPLMEDKSQGKVEKIESSTPEQSGKKSAKGGNEEEPSYRTTKMTVLLLTSSPK